MRRAALCALAMLAAAGDAAADHRWWLGFIDQSDRAFLEIPSDPRGCAERDRLASRQKAEPGSVLVSARSAAAELPPGARLVIGVADLAGDIRERVFPRVSALVREDEKARPGQLPACWYLAEAGTDRSGYRVMEDRLAVGVFPPRALAMRGHEDAWRSYGASLAGADSRFLGAAEAPGWVRELVQRLLPGADLIHAQPFQAVQARAAAPQGFWLVGGVRGGGDPAAPGTYDTLNLIVADDAERKVVFQAGPSGGIGRDRAGSFVAQVVATVDLDGDGGDELLLRARHYSGGSLLVLKREGSVFSVVRRGGYEGE